MPLKLADRIHRIQPSATLAMTAKAAELKRQNKPVYNMSVGEPDFSTPLNIQQAGEFAIKNGHTKYTPGSGTHELKEAICNKIKRDNLTLYRYICNIYLTTDLSIQTVFIYSKGIRS